MNIEDDAMTPEERVLERELAQRLARLGPQREPSPALDARILAAARAAAAQPRPPRRKAAKWPAVLGIAASLALALGLAWRLRPEPAPVATTQPVKPAEEPLADYVSPPPPAEVYVPRPKRVLEVPAPPPAEEPARTHGRAAAKPKVVETPAVADEPPYAFEAAPAPAAIPAPSAAPPPAPAPRNNAVAPQAAADAALLRREAAEASAARAQQAPAQAAAKAAAATAGEDEVDFAEPDEEVVPPATADSPQVRDAWLQRIRELAKAGRLDEARTSLREFRHRYPNFALPDDLRALGE